MKKPRFLRQLALSYKRRLGMKWRKPRGLHSKLREQRKGKGFTPSVSYGTSKKLKYLHPSGLKEVLVSNIKNLEKIDANKEAVKISHSVGKKKKQEIVKKAEERKIKVLNP